MSTKPRILHLCSNRWNSAIAEYALSSVRCLASDTEQQAIVLRGSPLVLRLKPLVGTLELPSFSLSQIVTVSKCVLRFRPNIIICYGGPELSLVAAVQTVIGTIPTIRFFGDASRIYMKPSVFSSVVINRICDRLILPSPKLASTWSGFFPNIKVQSITIGLNDKKLNLRPDLVRSLRPTLLIFGRIDPIKGHYQAMTIFQELLKIWPTQTPRPLLRIVGRAANLSHQQLRDHARTIKLSDDDLDLVDEHINDITALMNEVHLGWISSLGSEVICRVTQEFLLCGTAVVTTNAGTLTESVFAGGGRTYPVSASPADVAADIIKPLLLECYTEAAPTREERSRAARSLFADKVMRTDLLKIISEM